MRRLINAGHRAGGRAIRTVGDNHEPRAFDVFSPMAIAAIGAVAPTIIDRSITVRLRRRLASEPIAPLRLDRCPDLNGLARQLARFAADCGAMLAHADPALPGGIVNRIADNWRPLFAVAELAGGGWPDLAEDSATALRHAEPEDASVRMRLLADIREAFGVLDRLASEVLVDTLNGREDRAWSEFGRARKPLTKVQVAQLLKPLGIAPGTIRLLGAATAKGYYRSQFDDAFGRYL